MYRYELDVHFWEILLKEIWQRKKKLGARFLKVGTYFDPDRFLIDDEDDVSPTVVGVPTISPDFDDDESPTRDKDEEPMVDDDTVEIYALPVPAAQQDTGEEELREEVEEVKKVEEKKQVKEVQVESGPRPIRPAQDPMWTAAEELVLRGGGGTNYKPEKIVKYDGSEHKVDSNKYV